MYLADLISLWIGRSVVVIGGFWVFLEIVKFLFLKSLAALKYTKWGADVVRFGLRAKYEDMKKKSGRLEA